MANALRVGALCAESGTKTRGTVSADLGTLTVDIPLTLVNGAHSGPRVVITAGVHGGEFTGVDAATRLAALLAADEVHGQVVLCPVANPPAVYQGRLGASPVDGVNINRVFPGDPGGSPTERLAAWLFAHLLDGADAYLDLHSGGIDEVLTDFVGYRLTGNPELDARTAEMAGAFGIQDVVFGMNADGGNSHAAAARQGLPAILVETGQLGGRDEETARRLVDRLCGVLGRLGVLDAKPQDRTTVRAWVWAAGVTAEAAGLWYPEFTAGDDVSEGRLLGRVIEPADGREHEVLAPATGRIFYGMHALTVAPGAELAAIAAPAPRDPGP